MSILLALSLFACKGDAYQDRGDNDDTGTDTAAQNTAPVIESISLSPELALTADAIVATVVSSDADEDPLTTSYAWTVDGQAAGGDTDTLPAELSAKGQVVVVKATVEDASESVSQESEPLTIANTLPVLESVRIGPAGATTRDDLRCNVPTDPTDADGDALTGSIIWMQNGKVVSPLGKDRVYPGDTVLASQTEGDDLWSCEVSISDGEASVAQSAQITLPPSKEVLIIWDVEDVGTPTLIAAFEKDGLSVTLSDTDEDSFDGTNPALASFDAVVHLSGTTYAATMDKYGQQALVDFVNAGGGYIHTEWSAYEVDYASLSILSSVLALQRDSGTEGIGQSYTVTSAHPVVANVPKSFTTVGYCGGNIGTVANGATAVATSTEFGDAVAVNEVGAGRVVGFAHAGNYQYGEVDPAEYCFADPNLVQMMVDAVQWTLE